MKPTKNTRREHHDRKHMACTANPKRGPIELTYVDILSNEAIVPLACTPAFWKVASLICVADSISSVLGCDRKNQSIENPCRLECPESATSLPENRPMPAFQLCGFPARTQKHQLYQHRCWKKTSVWVEICERVALPLWQTQCILHTALALGLKWQLWVFNACIT